MTPKYDALLDKVREKDTGAGGGAVDSVNGQTGVVVLDTGDLSEVADKKYVTDAEKAKLADLSGVNTGDQDFLTLPDTPNTYVGQALKTVRVNAGATGLEFAVGGGGGGTVDTIVEGLNISVDATDPANPIVSAFLGNIDGGVASSLFLPSQVINGGTA